MTATTVGSTDGTSYPTPAASMARLFRDRVDATPQAEAYRFPRDGGWQSVTWADTEATVRRLAAGRLAIAMLRRLGEMKVTPTGSGVLDVVVDLGRHRRAEVPEERVLRH